jgi:hypothetical protein
VLLFSACALAFILVNPVVLLPSTVKYMLHYAGEGTVIHHAYLVIGRLYFDDPAHLRGGMPIPLFPDLEDPASHPRRPDHRSDRYLEAASRGRPFLSDRHVPVLDRSVLAAERQVAEVDAVLDAHGLHSLAALGFVKIFAWTSTLVSDTRRRLVPVLATVVALVFLVEQAWVSGRSGPYYTLYLKSAGAWPHGLPFPSR